MSKKLLALQWRFWMGSLGTQYSFRFVCGDKTWLRLNNWMMNQVTTQEIKVNRSQIIADADVSGNLKMDREAYEDLQLLAASDSWCDDGLASPFRLSTVHIWKIYLASNTMHPVKGFRVRCSLVGGRPGQIIHPAWVKRSKSYWHKIWPNHHTCALLRKGSLFFGSREAVEPTTCVCYCSSCFFSSDICPKCLQWKKLLMVTPLWHNSVWLFARHWPAKVEPSPSPSPSALASSSPWNPMG